MVITVSVHEAKTHLSRLLEQAHAGEEVILTQAGNPCARPMPLAPVPAQRRPGRFEGQIDTAGFFDPLPINELDAWEGR